jgi:nucleotide-binding universal stress UspA family protein
MDLSTVSTVQRRAQATLDALVKTVDPSREMDISTEIVSGAASVQMARAAAQFGADLLVMGTRGEHDVTRGRVTLGGTSTKLVGTTFVPLLLVRTAAASEPTSVLACVDFSPVSTHVLSWARASLTTGGTLRAFHAYETPFAARLDAYGMGKDAIEVYSQEDERKVQEQLAALIGSVMDEKEARRILVRGDPIDHILAQVKEIEPDLIVLGKHTRRARRRSVSWAGSVSRHIALFAPTNVLVVSSQE